MLPEGYLLFLPDIRDAFSSACLNSCVLGQPKGFIVFAFLMFCFKFRHATPLGWYNKEIKKYKLSGITQKLLSTV
jgi:hypothetical protein